MRRSAAGVPAVADVADQVAGTHGFHFRYRNVFQVRVEILFSVAGPEVDSAAGTTPFVEPLDESVGHCHHRRPAWGLDVYTLVRAVAAFIAEIADYGPGVVTADGKDPPGNAVVIPKKFNLWGAAALEK